MAKLNSIRRGCKDVFRAFMVRDAVYSSDLEIPRIAPEATLPESLVPFSKALSGKNHDAWVHFYEDDAAFERLWNSPLRYLPILKRYKGVIAPDFSLYRDMPLVMQQWNVYRSHAVAVWLQSEGVPVIANVRWGDGRTYDTCCAGVPKGASIAVGSHGCLKILREREYFTEGLNHIVKTLYPKTIVVYGAAPDSIFGKYIDSGIKLKQFDSDFTVAHRKEVSE